MKLYPTLTLALTATLMSATAFAVEVPNGALKTKLQTTLSGNDDFKEGYLTHYLVKGSNPAQTYLHLSAKADLRLKDLSLAGLVLKITNEKCGWRLTEATVQSVRASDISFGKSPPRPTSAPTGKLWIRSYDGANSGADCPRYVRKPDDQVTLTRRIGGDLYVEQFNGDTQAVYTIQ